MTYRSDGLRVEKEDSTGTLKFVWDGQNMLLETNANGVTQADYTLQPAGYGNLISQRRLGSSSFFHFDALGSTDRLTTALQAITDSYCSQSATNSSLCNLIQACSSFIWLQPPDRVRWRSLG